MTTEDEDRVRETIREEMAKAGDRAAETLLKVWEYAASHPPVVEFVEYTGEKPS